MAIRNQYNTPKRHDSGWRSFPLDTENALGSSGTFNGLTVIAATGPATLFGKHRFMQFDSSGGPASQRQCIHFNFSLPDDYKPNTDVKFRFVWTENSNTGEVQWQLGFTKPTSAGLLGTEATTEYQNAFQNGSGTPATTFDPQTSSVFTFDGSGLQPGDPVSMIIFRDGTADAHSDVTYFNMGEFFYQTDRLEKLNETDNIIRSRKTPKQFKTVRKSWYIRPENVYVGGTDTWNGVAVTTAGIAVLSDRWYTQLLSPAANDSFSCQFIMPYDWALGSTFKVRVSYFKNGVDPGDFDLNCGLIRTASNGDYGDEGAEATYQQQLRTNNSTKTNEHDTVTFTFTGENIAYGEKLTLAFYRHASGGSDTITDQIGVTGINIEYESYVHGNETEPV